MSVANRLYDVGHGVLGTVSPLLGIPALYISGSFPSIPATVSYEGRLQIHNAIGDCTVKLLSGDLPGGYSLSVDNTTSEVVLTWPAHGISTTLPNNNFALGDTGYDKGAGWSIVQGDNTLDPDDPGNSWEGLFVHQIGESEMMSQTFFPCTPGATYTASIDVQTGNAREHSHGAAVRLLFYDVSGRKIDGAGNDGNVVKQTTGNAWAKSSVSTVAPALASYIKGGFSSYRMHQDYALWVDNFQWDVENSNVGTSTEDSIPLSLRVKDSAGRTADWSGTIEILAPAIGARMWRVWITANCDSGSDAYINLSLIALRDSPNGVNLCVGSGGVATQSSEFSSTTGVVNAFENPNLDGTVNPNGRYWHSGDQEPWTVNTYGGKTPSNPWWAAYDFGAGNIKYVSTITFVPTNVIGRWPVDFEVQTSNDGTNWVTVASYTNFQDGNANLWGLGTPRSISFTPTE